MLSIDSGDFLNDPLSFGFNNAKQIYLFFHIFDFQGPSWTSNGPNIFATLFFLGNRRR
jgi:hypothetical protein